MDMLQWSLLAWWTVPFSSFSGLWETQSTPETSTCWPAREELPAGSQCHRSRGPHPRKWAPPYTYPNCAQTSTHHPFTQQVGATWIMSLEPGHSWLHSDMIGWVIYVVTTSCLRLNKCSFQFSYFFWPQWECSCGYTFYFFTPWHKILLDSSKANLIWKF